MNFFGPLSVESKVINTDGDVGAVEQGDRED